MILKNKIKPNKIKLMIFVIIAIFSVLLLNACTKSESQQPIQKQIKQDIPIVSSEDVSILTPQEAVLLYFQAWNDEQYDIMYSLISDGFKEIEPTAKTFNEYKAYMEKFYDTNLGVNVADVKESYNNGKEAGVEYKIEIINTDGTKKEFKSIYTLKKRTNGWKLIHPYGKNIDTT